MFLRIFTVPILFLLSLIFNNYEGESTGLKLFTLFLNLSFNLGIIYYVFLYDTLFKFGEGLLLLFVLIIYNFYFLTIRDDLRNNIFVKSLKVILLFMGIISFIYFLFVLILGSNLLNKDKYSDLVNIKPSNFSEDFSPLNYDEIPYIDKKLTYKITTNSLNKIEDKDLLYSLNLSLNPNPIIVKGRPKRISIIYYKSFLRWNIHKDKGQYGYILVDMLDGSVDIVKASEDKPIMYTTHDYGFKRNITSKLTKKYRREDIESNFMLDLDDKGNLYYVVPIYKTYTPKIKKLSKIAIASPYDGSIKEYDIEKDKLPSWLSRVYDENFILKNLKLNYKFKDGWFNSLTRLKTTYKLTSNHTYVFKDDSIWLYSGVKAYKQKISENEYNISYLMTNLTTGETKQYDMQGLDERTAMNYVNSSVLEKNYKATFPILLNINNKPTYYMSIKDYEGLIKGHALVDITDISKTYISKSLEDVYKAYVANTPDSNNLNLQENLNVIESESHSIKKDKDIKKIKGNIVKNSIKDVVIEGNNYRILKIEDKVFKIPVDLNLDILYITESDVLEISYVINQNNENIVKEVKIN